MQANTKQFMESVVDDITTNSIYRVLLFIALGFHHKERLSEKRYLRRLEEMTRGNECRLCDSSRGFYVTLSIHFHKDPVDRFLEILCCSYEKIHSMIVNNKVMKYEELLRSINTIVQAHSLLECEILDQLTKVHIKIQHWRFLPTLMAPFGAQTRMSAWERTLQSKENSNFHCKHDAVTVLIVFDSRGMKASEPY
uniref:Uncharacterized protein n=1 Tax=Vespula pensylvanica TaxID=30213 RepID=A0A834UBI3_VESPE|nr:hypothetical protein H0235_007378 [Vespula pensylvanica]